MRPKPLADLPLVALEMFSSIREQSYQGLYGEVLSAIYCSPVMAPVWRSLKKAARKSQQNDHGWPNDFMLIVTSAWLAASNPSDSDLRSDRERELWLRSTLTHTRQLAALVDDSHVETSLLDEELFPDAYVIRFLQLLGVPYQANDEIDPDTYVGDPYERRRLGIPVQAWELKIARNNTLRYLPDLLKSFETKLLRGIDGAGPLKKLRDEKSYRARFIYILTRDLAANGLSVPDVRIADICAVVLRDESVTRSLVNRFRFRMQHERRIVANV